MWKGIAWFIGIALGCVLAFNFIGGMIYGEEAAQLFGHINISVNADTSNAPGILKEFGKSMDFHQANMAEASNILDTGITEYIQK